MRKGGASEFLSAREIITGKKLRLPPHEIGQFVHASVGETSNLLMYIVHLNHYTLVEMTMEVDDMCLIYRLAVENQYHKSRHYLCLNE
jgi:hypothetical protein